MVYYLFENNSNEHFPETIDNISNSNKTVYISRISPINDTRTPTGESAHDMHVDVLRLVHSTLTELNTELRLANSCRVSRRVLEYMCLELTEHWPSSFAAASHDAEARDQ